MTRTTPLRVVGDAGFEDGKVVIHPNSGIDLGIRTSSHPVRVFFNASMQDFQEMKGYAVHGQLFLNNSCKLDTVELSAKQWAAMGRPKQVLLLYENNKLLIYGKPAAGGPSRR